MCTYTSGCVYIYMMYMMCVCVYIYHHVKGSKYQSAMFLIFIVLAESHCIILILSSIFSTIIKTVIVALKECNWKGKMACTG